MSWLVITKIEPFQSYVVCDTTTSCCSSINENDDSYYFTVDPYYHSSLALFFESKQVEWFALSAALYSWLQHAIFVDIFRDNAWCQAIFVHILRDSTWWVTFVHILHDNTWGVRGKITNTCGSKLFVNEFVITLFRTYHWLLHWLKAGR